MKIARIGAAMKIDEYAPDAIPTIRANAKSLSDPDPKAKSNTTGINVTSEVFFKVYRSLGRYRPEHALSTWLYRITVNAALDRKRSLRHESRTEEISPSLADGRPSAHEQANDRERSRLLKAALERIPDHYRSPLVLAHLEGMPLEEIARVLELPEGTVKSRLFRARAMLKEIIRRHYPTLAPRGLSESAT